MIPDKLTTDPPFNLEASATSGLPVIFEVTEGPATVNGNLLTLTGEPGFVTVKASQPGNGTWAPAPDVFNTFEVIDPLAYQPDLTIRRPADETYVYMTDLNPIIILASAYIDHPDVLAIQQVTWQIGGQGGVLTEKDWNTGYFSAEWTPPSYGNFTLTVNATGTGGSLSSQSVSFEVTDGISDMNIQAFEQVQIMAGHETDTAEFVFPTYVGSFDQITCNLNLTCPAGGCDPWDRVGYMEARGPSGEWVEIFRYITPYGVPCNHSIDATDYASILQGLVEMRFPIGTFDANGFIIDVDFDFQEGTPQYAYSWVDVIWRGTFPFGDHANLQPVDTISWNYAPEAEASKLKIISTGHAWGSLNTGNAAEFYEATHHIKVNSTSYDQHLWVDCNPNPDGCQPQNGTWYYNRAGWCPGSISYVYDYDLSQFVNTPDVTIIYEFYPGYEDLCHPNHPDCVTGVTCTDCNDQYNPNFIISGNLVSYSNTLNIATGIVENNRLTLDIVPNPASESARIIVNSPDNEEITLCIYNSAGMQVESFDLNDKSIMIDLSGYNEGLYLVRAQCGTDESIVKMVVR